MKRVLAAVLVMGGILVAAAPDASAMRAGVGANYWVAVEEIDDQDFDENGLSWLASIQFLPAPLIKIEADIELLPEGFLGSTDQVWAPQAYLLVGSFIYAGAGIGMYYTDGDFADDPFYALRAGFDFPVGPVHLDINANYRFEGKLDADNIDTDTIFLGAAVRFGF